MKRTAKYEIYERTDGDYTFRLKAANGKITNHRYKTEAGAARGIVAHRRAAATAKVVVLKKAK